MADDFGLYLSLSEDGHIKRDLTGPAGKVSLEDTTIRDELILFSELSFEYYAEVVDMIRTSAVFLCIDSDNRYIEGRVNPNVYEFVMETVADLVNTLMGPEESPLHGQLLWTAIEDLPADDGTDESRILICQELIPVLTEIMQFQFVVNEVLHDLCQKVPLDPEKYEGLWEIAASGILTLKEAGITTQYHFRSAVDYYHFLLLHFAAGKPNVARCRCCGRYFIPKTNKRTLYCDRILKDEKTCKAWGPVLKHRKTVQGHEVIEAFDRVKRKMYKRYERAEYGINQKPSEKNLNYAEYYQWLDRAVRARDDYLEGKISKEDALDLIEVQ